MNLVIVESPAKAKTINKYLGRDFKVLASFGHVRDLPSKDGSVRPDDDFAMDYEVSSSSKKHVEDIAKAVTDVDNIYLATDPDREGEAISWHVVEVLRKKRKLKKSTKIHRISFNEITKRAVTAAVNNPRAIDMDLVNAQQARRALDYLVGFTLSPVLWRKLPGSRSAGRVQSVALRLVCEREEEIEKFTSREYWGIKFLFATDKGDKFEASLSHINGKKLDKYAIGDEKSAKDYVKQLLSRKPYIVDNIEKKQARRNPYPPFITSSLQQEASRKLGFGAKKTMQIAQKLYEGVDLGGETVGLITYMRTDGVTVAQDAIDATRKMIASSFGQNYLPKAQRKYAAKAKNAQEAHEAIRPTDVYKSPDSIRQYLDHDQFRLYELIWKRLVASQMESAVLDQVAVTIKSQDGYGWVRATGSMVAFDGFYKLYREDRDDAKDDDDNKMLPNLDKGQQLTTEKIIPEQHFTQPPPRYSEASLVKRLEELGIGRPSTYAAIISVLQDRSYVKIEKRRFIPEDRGRIVTAFLHSFFSRYVEYDFTANLEEQLDSISDGKMDWKSMLSAFWTDFHDKAEEVKGQTNTEVIKVLNQLLADFLFPKDDKGEVDRSCPACDDGRVSLKLGKFGAFLGCSNYPECRHTKQLGSEGEEDGDEKLANEPKILGQNPDGEDISLRKGPYGFYIQLGDGDKPKRMSVPKNISPDDISLDVAQSLMSLPREVGKHPETGKVIKANIGRYGPYLQYDGGFYSLKDDSVLEIGINRAVTVIAESPKSKSNDPLKTLGKHPEDGSDIAIYSGRYGPYIKYKKLNVSIPKSLEVEDVDLDKAVELIKSKASKGKSSKAKKKSAKG